MDYPSTPDHRSQLSWTSSDPSSAQPSWLLSATGRNSQADTPCTRFSLASTILSGAEALVRRPTAGCSDSPARPPVTLKRKTSISPWSLFQSTKGLKASGLNRDATLSPTLAGQENKSKTGSRWWSPNRPVLDSNRPRQRISPPIPPRPDGVQRRGLLESHPELSRGTTTGASKVERPPGHQLGSSARAISPATPVHTLADLDPDKDGAGFSRVHKAGWDKVIPKHWMEDQFSDAFSVTDEERSIYSQDNGEEEAKKKLTSQLTSVINDNGFLAGEMTPFEPETVSHGHADAQCHSDRPERGVESRQLKEGPRWPFEGSIPKSQPATLTYTSTASPVQHWLSSIRPASPAVHNNEAPVKVRANPGLSLQQPGHSQTLHRPGEKTSTSDFTRARPSKLSSRDKAVPTPPCELDCRFLTPRPPRFDSLRRCSPIASIPEEGADLSYNPPVDISPRSQHPPLHNHPVPLSINSTSTPSSSSWSTILCTDANDSDSNSNVTLTQPRIHDATPLPTNRPSDKNKPLPLLPDEPTTTFTSTSPRDREAEPELEENHEKRDSLTDTIDQVLELYYRPDSESGSDNDQHDQNALIRPGVSCCSASTLTLQPSSSEPFRQAPHTPDTNTDTDVTFMLVSGGSSARFTPTPTLTPTRTSASASTPASTPMISPGRGSLKARDSDSDIDSASCPHSQHFVKSYPIFYDGMSYPELGRASSWDGRDRDQDRCRHRHRHQDLRQDERQGEDLDRENETHIRWSGSAVVTFVDHTGRTWI